MKITNARPEDLETLVRLEKIGFPGDEAAGREALKYRMESFPEYFLAARENGEIIGHIDGVLSYRELIVDEVYAPGGADLDGENLLIFGVATRPDFRNRGVAAAMMERLLEVARNNGVKTVALTCKPELVHYYARFGFTDLGLSESVLGGIVWHDMTLRL